MRARRRRSRSSMPRPPRRKRRRRHSHTNGPGRATGDRGRTIVPDAPKGDGQHRGSEDKRVAPASPQATGRPILVPAGQRAEEENRAISHHLEAQAELMITLLRSLIALEGTLLVMVGQRGTRMARRWSRSGIGALS